jgi:UDPglucose 6-dehydrogenase
VKTATSERIGFIGQGFIGKHMADDFTNRGFETVRYAMEEPYRANKELIAGCDITFIAVPTPTTPEGFDFTIIRSVLPLIGKGRTAVIKSTILPSTTEQLQQEFPDIFVLHSPEFLREKSAAEDTAHPERNIVGIPEDTPQYRELGERVLAILPEAPHEYVTLARNAEAVKYIGNVFLALKVDFMNIAYDFVLAAGGDWETVRTLVTDDSRIGPGHTRVVDTSGTGTTAGRGAGGHCFPKDLQAFTDYFAQHAHDPAAQAVLTALRNYNNHLLTKSGKDLDLLEGNYGRDIPTA